MAEAEALTRTFSFKTTSEIGIHFNWRVNTSRMNNLVQSAGLGWVTAAVGFSGQLEATKASA